MALTEAVINFNYNKAIQKADELDAAAKTLENDGLNEIGSIMIAIKRDWEGQNADDYLVKCNKEKENIRKVVEDMKKTASTIRSMAKTVYDAEMRALAIARAAAEAARKAAEAAANALK